MKHKVRNIKDELSKIYWEYDSFSVKRVMYDDIEKIGQHFYDNFYKINQDSFDRRLDRSEDYLNEPLWLKYEFGLLSAENKFIQGEWPIPQILIGSHTNL